MRLSLSLFCEIKMEARENKGAFNRSWNTTTGEGEAALLPDKVLRAGVDRAEQLLRRRRANPLLRIGQGAELEQMQLRKTTQ